MAKLLQDGKAILTMSGSGANLLFAHLQTAAFARFRDGQGFFITFFGGADNDGDPMPTNSIWCPPQVSLHFFFDDYDEPLEIQPEIVDAISRAMNDPIGVVVTSSGHDAVWPFTLLSSDRVRPPDDQQSPDQSLD